MLEKIKFEITLNPIFWDKPPYAKILLDDEIKFEDTITRPQTISFFHDLNSGQHSLQIERSNKTNNQYVSAEQDQKLILDKVKIDNINIRNIVWHYSYFIPKYPQPWALYQRKQGISLEEKIPGETTFGHNGTWYLHFTSPFYSYIFDWMKDNIK